MRGHTRGFAALVGGEHSLSQRRHRNTEHLKTGPQFLNCHLLGITVHAEDGGHLAVDEEAGHRLVRRDHALLDERVGIGLALHLDRGDPTLLKVKPRLGGGNVERSTAHPAGP